jgi:hypothetical protein
MVSQVGNQRQRICHTHPAPPRERVGRLITWNFLSTGRKSLSQLLKKIKQGTKTSVIKKGARKTAKRSWLWIGSSGLRQGLGTVGPYPTAGYSEAG